MDLMNSRYGSSCIYHRRFPVKSFPHKPVIEIGSSHGKRRQLSVEALWENEIIGRPNLPHFSTLFNRCTKPIFPIRIFEVKQLPYFQIPASSDNKIVLLETMNLACRFQDIVHQQNIAVHKAHYIVVRKLLRFLKQITYQRSPIGIPANLGNVVRAVLLRCVRCTIFVAEEDHLAQGVKPRPASQRIVLYCSNMSHEWFRYRKNSKHCQRSTGKRLQKVNIVFMKIENMEVHPGDIRHQKIGLIFKLTYNTQRRCQCASQHCIPVDRESLYHGYSVIQPDGICAFVLGIMHLTG
jgi:hypothetical protein